MWIGASWERPWKPPKCFICKLQSDSWKTWFSNVDLQILMKITVLPLWVTLNGLRIFLWFSQFSLNSKQCKPQRKQELSLSHMDFHCFELLGSTNAHDFSIEILKELHWKRTCEKPCISRIITKTNEIATFRPLRIDVKTTAFSFSMKITSLLSTYEKSSKNITYQKTC